MDKFSLGLKRACALFFLCAATAMVLPAQTLTTLYSFCSHFNCTDGYRPNGLVQASDGSLYGTAYDGGINAVGTVFRITPSGVLTTLYSFCSQRGCTDGENPFSGLIQASDGNLYGTTFHGGANDVCVGGCGTVFKITPGGALTTLHQFCSQSDCTDGELPRAGLVQASDGNLYGTTSTGGANAVGTVFKITRSGGLTTLYSFCSQSDCTDGEFTYAGLVQASDGNLYGTTVAGGVGGQGTVFKITLSGVLTTLHSFDGGDGDDPVAGLVQASDGNFYGITFYGGAYEYGTVFKITPSGALTTLYSFCSANNCPDGYFPYGALVQATDGNLYGTTSDGGVNNYYGTVFKITRSGALTTLYRFCSPRVPGLAAQAVMQDNCLDGSMPYAGLIQDTNGEFYGTTSYGGLHDDGTLFSMAAGLRSFIEAQPTSGKVGQPVKILGSSLTGATSVTFNGVAASFTVISGSLITSTVPQGATTGLVKVTTPGGTLISNLPFRVRQ